MFSFKCDFIIYKHIDLMPSFSIRKNIFLIQSIELFQCLDTFLQFTQYEILNNAGKVTAEVAKSFCGK